jgi:hypothetical protein
MAPLGWLLNTKHIYEQYINMFMIIDRVPILLIKGDRIIIVNFTQFFRARDNIMSTFFDFKADNDIQNAFNLENNAGYWENLQKYIIGYAGINQDENDHSGPIEANGFRNFNLSDEKTNQVYKTYYSDGQYTGMTSPMANDWFQSNNSNVHSNFNNCSLFKCLFQMATLGNISNEGQQYYTLTNACVIVSVGDGGGIDGPNAFNMKYTGKYWLKPITGNEDAQPNNVSTAILISRLCKRINDDNELKQDIFRELDINFPEKDAPDFLAYTVKREANYTELENKQFRNRAIFTCKLFQCALGLEQMYKQELALTISGILGHSWDCLLKYFQFTSENNISKQLETFRAKYPSFDFIKHNGTPIASYIYDFKGGATTNMMGGYNAVNFSRILNLKILNIRDKISTKTIYTPPNIPNCLIPIVFNNALLQCKTHCYRSYKKLMTLMKTRKQRDFLFDRLTNYGKRCMTILDPYGIFMHFHDDTRGIRPVN